MEMRQRPQPSSCLPGLSEPLAPAAQRLGYRFSVLLVAGCLILLPGVYLGLVALSLGVLGWHLINLPAWLGSAPAVLLHLALSGWGLAWSVALIKPLFAPRAHLTPPRDLPRETEPRLHAFVAQVFCSVGLSPPTRIELDHESNASARLGNSFSDLFRGKVSVLTIGLPLVAGLTTEQLAGVLAHECGHFRQRAGMRLSTMIRWIIAWFARLVYEQDEWDHWLQRRVNSRRCPVSTVLRIHVALSRYLLWGFLTLGRLVASYLLRQMELDADTYEVKLVGTETFAATVYRMHELALAQETAIDDMLFSFREGRVTTDFPGLVVQESEQLAEMIQAASQAEMTRHCTWLDSHPSDAARIQSSHRVPVDETYRNSMPAYALFDDFDAACARLTADMNQRLFGPAWQQAEPVPLDAFVQKHNDALDDLFALKRVFGGAFSVAWGMCTPELPPHRPSEGSLDRLWRCAGVLAEERGAFVERATALEAARFEQGDLLTKGEAAQPISPLEDLQVARFEEVFWEWVESAQALLASPLGRSLSPDPRQSAKHMAGMWSTAAELYKVTPHFREAEQLLVTFEELLEQAQQEVAHANAVELRLERTHHELATTLHDAHRLLDAVTYPFATETAESISTHIFDPSPREEQSPLASAYAFIERFPDLYARVIGRLCRMAEEVEHALRAKPHLEQQLKVAHGRHGEHRPRHTRPQNQDIGS